MDKHKKVFTGTVTKFIENFGIIDEDVFFRIEVVEGGSVKINDQVYVECEYSEQLPFKWNATKVKVLSLQRVAPTYLQHRMQQMLQQSITPAASNNLVPNQLTNKNNLNVQDQASFYTPEIRNLIEKQQPQSVQNFQNNQSFNRQNEFNNSTSFGQITYTSTPGSAFVSSVLPFNQINVQQPLQLPNLRQFPSNSNANNFKKDNSRGDERSRDDFKNNRDNRDRLRKDDRDQRHRDIDRDKDRVRDNRNNRDRDNRDSRDIRDFKDTRDNREINRENRDNIRDRQKNRRNTDSPVSNTSNNSKPRRRYTPLNIPNNEILKGSLNSFDIKRKFDSAIHIPSDFKELQLNETFELNIKALHKPIQYRINNSSSKEKKIENTNEETKVIEDKKENLQITESEISEEIKDNSEKLEDKPIAEEAKSKDDSISSKSDNLNLIKNEVKKEKKKEISNKYAVKVLLLSLPSMNDIFDRVFGSDKDNCTTSKAYFLHFNKLISFLCMKNHNDGHSLIGGKFDPKLDGFINEEEPNLIQTAIRCVKQQTGIDLSSCKKWKHLCTFLYNRDDSPFYENVPFEYSKIYIPDVWSLLENHEKKIFKIVNNCLESKNNSDIKSDEKNDLNSSTNQNDQDLIDNNSSGIKEEKVSECESNNDLDKINNSNGNTCNDESLNLDNSSNLDDSKLSSNISNTTLSSQKDINDQNNKLSIDSFDIDHLNDLKVTTLRAHLEELGIKVVKNMKKADLVQKLATYLKDQQELNLKSNNSIETQANEPKEETSEENTDKLMEHSSESQNNSLTDNQSLKNVDETNSKRKLEEDFFENESNNEQNKKLKSESCHDESSSTEKDFKQEFEKTSEISKDGFIMAYSNNSISVLSLFQALSHNKYDHFELQIVAQILKEALIDHFCNYILSACFENKNLIKEQEEKKDDIKDTIENNYILLAFSYFDSCHCGYMLADDLLRLFNSCKINFSKRTWSNIFGNHERIKYRNLKDPLKIHNFKKTFESQSNKSTKNSLTNSLFVKDGNIYDVDKLISQSENDEKFKVELKDKLKISEETIRNLQESLNELDSKQKKTSLALKKQNDEICDLKREKEKTKLKYSEALKLITSTIDSFTEFSKKQEEKQDKTKETKSTTLAI